MVALHISKNRWLIDKSRWPSENEPDHHRNSQTSRVTGTASHPASARGHTPTFVLLSFWGPSNGIIINVPTRSNCQIVPSLWGNENMHIHTLSKHTHTFYNKTHAHACTHTHRPLRGSLQWHTHSQNWWRMDKNSSSWLVTPNTCALTLCAVFQEKTLCMHFFLVVSTLSCWPICVIYFHNSFTQKP